MLHNIFNIFARPEIEIIILMVLLVYFFAHRKDPHLVVSGVRFVRTLIVMLVFFYFMFIWASSVQPTLRSISILGMFFVNVFMFYNLLQARLARPYRDALDAVTRAPEQHELIHEVWRTGRRYYYLRYAWSSLFSGGNPFHFLYNISADRVRDDIKDTLHRYGIEKRLISLEAMAAFLKSQLACDEDLPTDFKEMMEKVINDFAKHPYIEEHANEFLRLATESPEDLHFPEWMSRFEACVRTYRKP